MTINCAEFEILLCDAVDGQLRGESQAAFEAHQAQCAGCREYSADVLGATAFLGRVAEVEAPKELITRILFETPGGRAAADAASPRGLAGRIRQWFGPVLAPKFAMGMAMTILSISMLSSIFKIPVRPLRPSDLDPAQIWVSLDDQAHRAWTRAVKYYENVRLVYEIQSRLKEWSDQEELERQHQQRNGAEKISVPINDTAPPQTGAETK